MRISGFSLYLFAACCLLMSSPAQAQQAYGYASITFDENNDTATGYASTEVDYETAYYYDAEVQAHIEDENGNVLGSGAGSGNLSALTFFDVIHAALCIRISIISYVIVAPRFLGCDEGGYFDEFGFSDYWWGWYWDFGDFSLSRRNRCIFGRLIFIASIISDFIRGSTRTLREFDRHHWHLRFEFGNPPAVAIIGSVPADEVPAAVPGVIEAERYDSSGDDDTAGSFVPDDASMSDPNFPGIIYNYPQVLPITGNEEQSYVPTAGGQWMNYTVNVASTGSYTFEVRVASPYAGNTFHVEVDGVDRTGPIYIPNTGSGDVYQFVTVNDISLDAGQRVIRVVIDGTGQSKGNFDYFTINPYFPPQFCNPEWWEIQDCQNSGGSWDYGLCGCQYYGCFNGQCEILLY